METSLLEEVIRDGNIRHGDGRSIDGSPVGGETDDAARFQEHADIIDNYVATIEGTNWTTGEVYFSDVVACRDSATAAGICESIVRSARLYSKNDVVIISLHDDHIHIIHSCPYSNRSCRCSWLQNEEIQANLRRKVRQRNRISSLGGDDWRNILYYFSTEGRRIVFVKLRGKMNMSNNCFLFILLLFSSFNLCSYLSYRSRTGTTRWI